MNRATLSKATNTDEGNVPFYILQEICQSTYASRRDCEKIAEFLIQRLTKSNINTKVKALNVITKCSEEGDPHFRFVCQHYSDTLRLLAGTTDNADPKFVRVQTAAREAIDSVFRSQQSTPLQGQSHMNDSHYGEKWRSQQQPPQSQKYYGGDPSLAPHDAGPVGGFPDHSNGQPQFGNYGGNGSYRESSHQPHVAFNTNANMQNSYDDVSKNTWATTKRASGSLGVWGSQGFTQPSPNQQYQTTAPPTEWRYNERDNRPTILVPQSSKQSWKEKMSAKFSSAAYSTPTLNIGNTGSGGKLEHLSKQVSILTKKGIHELHEAKEKWDRRGMDKSMAKSLAEHDDYTKGTRGGLDRGYYQPQRHVETGGGDTSGDYERGLVDNLCVPGGLARAPPKEALNRFVELAQTLDAALIGELISEKLMEPSWQVRLKALCVIEALLEAPGCSHYGEWFEDNSQSIQQLTRETKSNVRSKAIQILELLGLEQQESTSVYPSAGKRSTAYPGQSTDILGFEELNLSSDTSVSNLQQQQPQASLIPQQQQLQASLIPQQQQMQLPQFRSQQPQHQQPVGYQQPAQHQNPPPAQQQNSLQLNCNDPFGIFGSFQQPQPPMNHSLTSDPTQDTRTRALSNVGKDLFTQAHSPINSKTKQESAFPFL